MSYSDKVLQELKTKDNYLWFCLLSDSALKTLIEDILQIVNDDLPDEPKFPSVKADFTNIVLDRKNSLRKDSEILLLAVVNKSEDISFATCIYNTETEEIENNGFVFTTLHSAKTNFDKRGL